MRKTGSRLQVRTPKYEDASDLYEIYSNQSVGDTAGWKAHQNMQVTRNILTGFIYGNETFVIELLDTKKVIGTISLYEQTARYRVRAADTGFSLNPLYVGNGYMKESVSLILEYAFNDKKYEIVGCSHIIGNEKSENTIRSSGFVFEGLIRKYRRLYNGLLIDAALYSMTSEEYRLIQ